jgi:outer membrane murein-binding lipoprotein Lpp
LASTGNGGRRTFLTAAAAGPLVLAGGSSAGAADYTSAAQVFASVERLEAEVDARLRAIEAALPGAVAFAASVRKDRARHRSERARLRRLLGLPSAAAEIPAPAEVAASLEVLRVSQEALVHAHAEGLPALGDRRAVDRLGAHLVDLARQLAVIELWIEQEEGRG